MSGGENTDQNEKLKTEVRRVRLRELKLLEKNARYMTAQQMGALVDNLRRDGRLTSVPLCAPLEDGSLEVLSGNHRVKAAIIAGIEEADVIVITTPLDKKRKLAIQLSHNAIAGQDDLGILLELYSELDLDWKKYSGLNDEDFNFQDLNLSSFNLASVKYEEIIFSFLPAEKQAFIKLFDEVERMAKKQTRFLSPISQFDQFFDAVVQVKRQLNVHNSAIALGVMVQLALERLEQLEAGDRRLSRDEPTDEI